VLHCSSFSKCLAPGYRVGWAAPGRLAREVERLKLMTSLSGPVPAQAALDSKTTGAETIAALALATLVLGVVHWLLREREDRLLKARGTGLGGE
jgi:DNA-binding transcriptional MocR family regulator